MIARGEYLVFGPAHCVECHTSSSAAFEAYAATGERPALSGGYRVPVPPIGVTYAKNLTPDRETGIGRYTDGQIARMLRYAVRPDGRASARWLMPYAAMSDDDLVAIVSFLRAQPAVRNLVPDSEWTLAGKVVKSLLPVFKPRTDVQAPSIAPPSAPTRERGEYLARGVATCSGCHSPRNQLTFALNGPEFSGGLALEPRDLPGIDRKWWFQPPNLTPHAFGGLVRFPNRDAFAARFQKPGRAYPASPMPWDCYRRMTSEDTRALYEFFQSLPPSGMASGDPVVRQ